MKSLLASLFGGKKSGNVSNGIKYAPNSSCCCGGAEKKESTCCDEKADAEDFCSCDAPVVAVKEVKVLGPGCAKCVSTFKVVEKVIKESGLDIKLTEVKDIEQMMSYNIMQTPAVVADEKVVIKGHVPSEDEVKKALGL